VSIESAKAFIERMKTDEDFAKKVIACKGAEARMAFVKAAGFEFTAAEIDKVKGTMSDAELAAVAGGSDHRCASLFCDHVVT